MAEEQVANDKPASPNVQGNPSKSKLAIFSKLGVAKIPIIFLIVALLGVGTALIITKFVSGKAEAKSTHTAKVEKKELGKFITLDPFTVNLTGGQNYLQIVVALEIDGTNTELEHELKERKPQISDSIITILSSKALDDISTNAGREKLKVEIKKAVDSLLGYGKIERVYFSTFIMQ